MASLRPRNRATTSRGIGFAVLAGIAALALLLLVPAGAGAAGGSTPAKRIHYPVRYTLTDSKIGHWSVVLKSVYARTKPRKVSRHRALDLRFVRQAHAGCRLMRSDVNARGLARHVARRGEKPRGGCLGRDSHRGQQVSRARLPQYT